MRLYPKKIHTLQELQEERKALKRAALEGGDIFNFQDKKFKKKGSKKENSKKLEDELEQETASDGLDMGGILKSITGTKSTMSLILSTGLPLVLEMIPRKTKIKYFRKFIVE